MRGSVPTGAEHMCDSKSIEGRAIRDEKERFAPRLHALDQGCKSVMRLGGGQLFSMQNPWYLLTSSPRPFGWKYWLKPDDLALPFLQIGDKRVSGLAR
jgi:hypothetical protein